MFKKLIIFLPSKFILIVKLCLYYKLNAMKTILNLMVVLTLFLACIAGANAQERATNHRGPKNKFTVSARLTEGTGTYSDRTLCRVFLKEAMKACPYITNFHIIELNGSKDNHRVVWIYNVNGWDAITHFYSWINTAIHTTKDSILIEALTPYAPDYALGGAISVNEVNKSQIAKN